MQMLEVEGFVRAGPTIFLLWVNVGAPYVVYLAGWKPDWLLFTLAAWFVQMTGVSTFPHRFRVLFYYFTLIRF